MSRWLFAFPILSGSGTLYRCDAGLKCRACNGGAERCIPQDAFCCSDPDASFGSFCTGEKQCKVCPGQKTRCVGGPTIDCCFANYVYCKADQECSKCPVQVRQQPYFGSTTIATNAAVAAKVGGHRVAFYADQLSV